MKEEKKITSQFDNDPLTALKSRELDLQAQENERKKKADQDQLNIDRMKAMMNQSTDQQKLQQNEELAKMRADTSIEKTIHRRNLKYGAETMKKVSKGQKKVGMVMKEFKKGKLHSGKSGKIVKNPKQSYCNCFI
jgi:hypothetical protein